LLKSLKARFYEQSRLLKKEVYALYLAYRDPRTPWYARVFALAIVAYAVSPIDLIPDFIPVLGYLDDFILIPVGIMLALKMIPPDVLAEARLQSERMLDRNHPAGRIAAAVIVLMWALFVILLLVALSKHETVLSNLNDYSTRTVSISMIDSL
jgi:uncharacterized membrane protein YkvA (DUF1232 family)